MGLGDSPVLLFQLLEEAHILDSDDGLVREGLQQRDLAVRKWPGLRASHHDRPERDTVTEHGDREGTPKATHQLEFRQELGIKLQIEHMDHSAIEDRPTRNQSSTGRGWKGATGDVERVGSP